MSIVLNKIEKNSLFEKAALAKRLDEKISQLKEQEEKIYNERKNLEVEKETIRDEIKSVMLASGNAIIKKKGEYTIKVKKGKGSVVVKDEELVPLEFKKTIVRIDKTLIRARLLSGEKIHGAELEINDFLVITG